jgi:predicted dehydrogenase
VRRIGFIGTENSHTDHFLRLLNTDARHPGFRGTALAGGAGPRNNELAATYGVDVVVENPADLLGRVDAAIVSTRDGARHREQAVPLLEAGVPVLVDKPLATTTADARLLLDAAAGSGAPLVSCSALRFVPEMPDLRDGEGPVRALHVVGPADPDSEHSGLFFYGIHHVEAALEILGNPAVTAGSLEVDVVRRGDTTVASTWVGGAAVTLTFVTPSDTHRVPFHATVVRPGSVVASELTIGPDYNAPALARFIAAAEAGTAPDEGALLAPVAVLESVVHALGKDHR